MANNKNKSSKPSTKKSDNRKKSDFTRNEESTKFKDTTKGMNDPSWYSENQDLLRDSASFSFNNPLGNRIDLSDGETVVSNDYSIPGVCALYTLPSVGKSVDNSSPVNIAARNIYSYVRHANSGHSNYDSPDLMLYLMAMDNLYSYFAWLVRAYGVIRTYSQTNRYLPKGVIQSMGLDFDDLQANLANFRYFINLAAEKIGSLCAPKSMSYFTRHMWMYTNIYADGPSPKASLFHFTPKIFYKYSPTSETTGGALVPVEITSKNKTTLMKFEDIRSQLNSMIAAVIEDEDMNIMSGDILKAFGGDGVFKLTTIPEDYVVMPTFNLEVLGQIQNAVLIGEPESASLKITQSTEGAILCNPKFTGNSSVVQAKKFVNSYSPAPNPGEIMVSTRLTVTGRKSDAGEYVLHSMGSDYVAYGKMFRFSTSEGGGWSIVNPAYATTFTSCNYQFDPEASGSLIPVTSQLEKFEMHPYMYIFTDGAETGFELLAFVGDVENYTLMSASDLEKLHETALLSQFNVPQMGAFARKS